MKREPQRTNQLATLLDSAIVGFLFIFAIAAPNSIAATQTAWLVGMALWLVRYILPPRPALKRTPIDYAIFGFFILSGISSVLSYEPMVSFGKMRAASLFTIIYLFCQNIPSLRIARWLAIALLSACMVNVVFTGVQRALGRAVKVYGVSQDSPLYKAGIRDGDTLLEVDNQPLHDPQELVNALLKPDKLPVSVHIYRHELEPVLRIPRGSVLAGNDVLQQLGIAGWTRGRDWRATGFYGQFVTYAEMLQLVIALAVGLFVSLPRKVTWCGAALMVAIAGMSGALLLAVTRASWLGCALSTLVILSLGMRRRALIVVGLLAIPLVLGGLFVLRQKRNVSFIDQTDQSTTWRETVWREGTQLLVSKPRHLLVGVGMDSLKAHWKEWHMFKNGTIPWGHMHSDFLQIALERGVPALLVWLIFLFLYARTLGRSLKLATDWIDRGILLGAFGGLIGFLTSGLVHYNWGDSEVVMVFYLIVGLSLAIHLQFANEKQTAARRI